MKEMDNFKIMDDELTKAFNNFKKHQTEST